MRRQQFSVAPGSPWLATDQSPVLFPAETFHHLIRNERRRVDRDGGSFALVVWYLGTRGGNEQYGRYLSLRIARKMRSVDSIGWLDTTRLGVLLPSTRLRESLALAMQAPEAFERMHWYPGGWDWRYDYLGERGS